MKNEDVSVNIMELLDEYSPDESLFSEEDSDMLRLKKIVYSRLDETDRRILIVYAHLGNVRDTAEVFRVSSTTIWWRIKQIREKIMEIYENDN